MSGKAQRSGITRHLSLVDCAPLPRPGLRKTARSVCLANASFRPGELPVDVTLRLNGFTVQRANCEAGHAGAPVELWVRAAIDAGRVVSTIAATRLTRAADVVALLDDHAAAGLSMLSGSADLARYAEALRRGERASVTRLGPNGEVELLVPEELALAWRCEASAGGGSIDAWATSMIGLAPDRCLAWEASAAASGLRLAEWGYAYALRRLIASSA
jgi:hypothetical protein